MNQTSRVLLALVAVLSIGCPKQAVDVGDSTDAGSGGKGGTTADSGGGTGGAGQSGSSSGRAYFEVLESPMHDVDVLFVIDNSPSMDPKQKALAEAFPKMIERLQKLEGGLPSIRIGVISSDMGAGGGEAGGNCSVVLGNRGILWGNDPALNPNYLNNQFATVANFLSPSGWEGCGMRAGARWIEDVRNTNGVGRNRNYQGELTDVFSCLAKAVGVGGCGYEHPLQSLRVALNPTVVDQMHILSTSVNPQNLGFLRERAYLAIVIVSDEDDCSASPDSTQNDGMFFPRTLVDTASLRCAARGHVCNGKAIPNYDSSLGYTGAGPFSASFADCEAKDDTDPHNLPLIRIQELIDSVKQVKVRPAQQILVAGIIGWPENGNLTGVQYRIDKDTTSMPPEQQKLWDYMPICSHPEIKSADGNIYKAYGGFRLKKFIDGFGTNGQTYSICNTDGFVGAMQMIGNALDFKLRPACLAYPLADANPELAETQPECQAIEKTSCDVPGEGACLPNGYTESPLSECIDPTTGNPLSPSNPATANIPDSGRPCWYLVYDMDPITGCPSASPGQKIAVLRQTGSVAPTGTLLAVNCRICDTAGAPGCPAQ